MRRFGWALFVAQSGLVHLGCQCSSDAAALTVLDDGGTPEDASRGPPEEGPRRDGGADSSRSDAATPADGPSGSVPRDVTVSTDAGVEASTDAGPARSLICGDGVRGLDEQCDDGNTDETDFCSSRCEVLERSALPLDGASQARGRAVAGGHHVVAGGRRTAVVLVSDGATTPLSLRAAVFRNDGSRSPDEGIPFSDEKAPYEPTEVAVASLPGDRYALAWTTRSVDGDGLGIALRHLDGRTGVLGPVQQANAEAFGAQQSVDAVWTGSELVLAWVDRGGAAGGRARVRRFGKDLVALGTDELLSDQSAQSELQPVLAAFNQSFAALWLEFQADFTTSIRVRAGGVSWTIPVLASFTGDDLRLAALDDAHLIAVWTQVDFDEESGLEIARLYTAVMDTSAPGTVEPVRVDPLSAALTSDPTRRMRRPTLAVVGSTAFVAWYANTSFGGEGKPALVLKEMPWAPGDAGVPMLDLSIPEVPLPRSESRAASGVQDVPALGAVPWTPGGALLAAWEDSGKTFGPSQRRPDVVAQLLPIPALRSEGGN